MSVIDWFLGLTPHELDVIRTFGGLLAAVSSVLAGVATVYARLAYKNAKDTKNQTVVTQWEHGQLKERSVADIAQQLHNDSSDHSEIIELINDPRTGPQIKVHGRRRDLNAKTDQITFSPRNRPPADESKYT